MIKDYAKTLLRPAWRRLQSRMAGIADERVRRAGGSLGALLDATGDVQARLRALEQQLAEQGDALRNLRRAHFVPDPAHEPVAESAPFMAYSNCQAQDFYHPRYARLAKLMAMPPRFHRKHWEWVYIIHQLVEAGVLRPGARGLGFGVGTEPLPAVFASLGVQVTATDAPPDLERAAAWSATRQHSGAIEQLLHPEIAPDALVRAQVTHRPCDMNHIDPALTGYDFNWSSCCFEHLGSLETGLQFVVNAVEQTLKPGGIAVHTTEYNASSNDATVASGDTVIYRRHDLEALVARLRERGHAVAPFVIGPTAHQLDYHVDVPPYAHDVHLKLLLAGYVTTSVGITVRRG